MNRREAIAALGAWALLPAAASLKPADLKGDIHILREALKLHPGLYRYARPGQVEDRLAEIERAFVGAPTLERRYLLLSRFMASIRCGHSYCNFFNQSDAAAGSLFDRPTRLPFHFTWIGGRMIVLRDPERLGLAPGSEIVAVNGVAARSMLRSLMPYARADGHNDAKRVALLGVGGGEKIETFDVFHGLVHGAPAGGVHRLMVRSPDGREAPVEVPAIGLAARRAQAATRDPGDGPNWDWTMGADGIARLTMPSWALYNSRWDWRSWLDERLSSLEGAKGLIVDLRDNEGGQEECGNALLERLAGAPIAVRAFERLVRFRTTPAELDPWLDTWDRSFRTLGAAAEPVGRGFLRLKDEGDSTIRPKGPRLSLPVAALIGPVNSSATFQFARKARDSGLVRLFGGTTGGNRRGINGGAYFFVRLPASGLEFDLPLIGYFPPGMPPDGGLDPDVAVAATARDIHLHRDPAMAAASAWALGRA